MKITFSRIAATAAAAILLCGGAVATAQPGMGGGGHGPGMGMDVEHMLAGLQSRLKLTPGQQDMWNAAIAASKSAREAGRASMRKVHDAMTAELANATPNLAGVASVAELAQADNQALRRSVRDQWLNLYATFSPEQITVVREALQQHLARMDSFHAKMLERMQRPGG